MKRKTIITAAVAAVTLAAVAVAGTAIAPAAGIVGTTFGIDHRAMPVGLFRAHGEALRIDSWIAFVEAELEITDAQRPQWDALVTAVRDNVGPVQEAFATRHRSREADENGRQSAVERLDAFEGLAAAGLAALRNVSPPFKALYAVLGDDQKERADRMLDHRGHRRWMRH